MSASEPSSRLVSASEPLSRPVSASEPLSRPVSASEPSSRLVSASEPSSPMVSTVATTQYRLGPIDQIPYGEGRTFTVAGEQVAVFRLRDGAVHALSAVCTHRGGPIADGQLDNTIVLCPLHMNAFELATGCSTTGAAPLRRYDVHLDGDQLVVSA